MRKSGQCVDFVLARRLDDRRVSRTLAASALVRASAPLDAVFLIFGRGPLLELLHIMWLDSSPMRVVREGVFVVLPRCTYTN